MIQRERVHQMERTCQLIKEGHYMKIDPNFQKARGMSRFLIDNFHQSLVCPIAKVGSSSWITMLRKLIDDEYHNRTLWYALNKRDWPLATEAW